MIRILQGSLLYALFALPAMAGEWTQVAPEDRAAADQKMCATVGCQHDVHTQLKRKDGSTYEHNYPVYPPIVQPIGLTIVVGQTIYVEGDIIDGKLTNLVAVDKMRDPARTIVATFTQQDDIGMILQTKNPFTQTIKFDMGIVPLDGDALVKTSSCPVMGTLQSFEMWPYPIVQVLLANGRVVASDDHGGMVCD
jgi:hypothetical protein